MTPLRPRQVRYRYLLDLACLLISGDLTIYKIVYSRFYAVQERAVSARKNWSALADDFRTLLVGDGGWSGNLSASQNILRACEGKATLRFRYADKGKLATIGLAAAVADFGAVRLSGVLAWLSWLFVHIFFLIGFRNRFLVLFEWAWSYFTLQRSARLATGRITEPPKT